MLPVPAPAVVHQRSTGCTNHGFCFQAHQLPPPADLLSVAEVRGQLRLGVRVGDTRPAQLREVHVRMWLYRWNRHRHYGAAAAAAAPDAAEPGDPDDGEPFEMHVRLRLLQPLPPGSEAGPGEMLPTARFR